MQSTDQYWYAISRRIWRRLFHEKLRLSVMSFIVGSLVANLVAWKWLGWSIALESVKLAIASVVGAVAAFLITFVHSLFHEPSLLENERIAAIENIQKQLSDIKTKCPEIVLDFGRDRFIKVRNVQGGTAYQIRIEMKDGDWEIKSDTIPYLEEKQTDEVYLATVDGIGMNVVSRNLINFVKMYTEYHRQKDSEAYLIPLSVYFQNIHNVQFKQGFNVHFQRGSGRSPQIMKDGSVKPLPSQP